MTDHIQKTKDMIAVMQAYVDGNNVETCSKFTEHTVWQSIGEPSWIWHTNDYRVSTTKDYIDWSHVSPEFKFMARDQNGYVYLYKHEPNIDSTIWADDQDCSGVTGFSSYRRGNCDWKYSLVRRPK